MPAKWKKQKTAAGSIHGAVEEAGPAFHATRCSRLELEACKLHLIHAPRAAGGPEQGGAGVGTVDLGHYYYSAGDAKNLAGDPLVVLRSIDEQRPVDGAALAAAAASEVGGRGPVVIIQSAASDSIQAAGAFSQLPVEVLLDTLLRLNLKDRLLVAIVVCKGLRCLRTDPAFRPLWAKLTVGGSEWMHGQGVVRLLGSWIPDPSIVKTLCLGGCCSKGNMHPADLKQVLSIVRDSVEELQLCEASSDDRGMTLLGHDGAALPKALLMVLTGVVMPKLLRLDFIPYSQASGKVILGALSKMPRLVRLGLKTAPADRGSIRCLLRNDSALEIFSRVHDC